MTDTHLNGFAFFVGAVVDGVDYGFLDGSVGEISDPCGFGPVGMFDDRFVQVKRLKQKAKGLSSVAAGFQSSSFHAGAAIVQRSKPATTENGYHTVTLQIRAGRFDSGSRLQKPSRTFIPGTSAQEAERKAWGIFQALTWTFPGNTSPIEEKRACS